MSRENHYQLLGIESSAPLPAVQAALERLVEQANRLAYTSPDRSRELWERIREIRHDLLSGSDRRRDYDASLQEARIPPTAAVTHAQPATDVRAPEAVVTAVPAQVPPSRGVHRVQSGVSRGVPIWPLLVVAGIAASALVLAFVLQRPVARTSHRVRYHVPPAPAGLSAGGFRKGTGFVSGKRITLRWHSVAGAALYHVQVASQSGAGSGFHHPLLSVTTKATSYSLKLPGERRYIWRVQALIAGRWTPRAGVKSFLVARPGTGAPQPQLPSAGSIQGGHVRLCWSPVPWAVAYLLRVQSSRGNEQIIVHGTCDTVTEKPGVYRWTVASLIRGVRTYTGPFSVVEHFTVPAPSTAAVVDHDTGLRVAGVVPVICSGRQGIRDVEKVRTWVMGPDHEEIFHVLPCDKIETV